MAVCRTQPVDSIKPLLTVAASRAKRMDGWRDGIRGTLADG